MIRKASRPLTYLLAAVVLITLVVWNPESRARASAQQMKATRPPARPSDDRLIVHEWGTFTAVAGRDGKPVVWRPLAGASDLPSFVYDLGGERDGKGLRHGRQCLKCEEALIRMETPVIYFYAAREMEVSARVDFLRGTITEWYPQARSVLKGEPSSLISWGRFTVLPGATESLPVEPQASHYYAARETDAALVRMCGQSERQHEKFLFYRGVGNFDLPLTVKLEGERLLVGNTGLAPVAACVVFEQRNGRVGYRIGDIRDGNLIVERPALDQTQDAVERELVSLLTGEGLYEKEARAMVATWRDSWFEDGLRVFYIVPRALTDKTLPLAIDPAPAELVRVLVGRTEIITPELEQAIQKQLELLKGRTADVPTVAMQIIRKHGRFAEPVLKAVLEQTNDPWLRARIGQVIRSARTALD